MKGHTYIVNKECSSLPNNKLCTEKVSLSYAGYFQTLYCKEKKMLLKRKISQTLETVFLVSESFFSKCEMEIFTYLICTAFTQHNQTLHRLHLGFECLSPL